MNALASTYRYEHLDHITGLVERVTFHSPETGFAVLRVKVSGQQNLVTVVGTLPSASAGEWLDARGRWTIDPDHGQQFKAELLRTSHPNTTEGIEKFLGSGMIKGIGPRFAARLVKTFGTEVFEVIENEPERLRQTEGVGPVRQGRIVTAWQEQKTVREIMVFLHSHGVGTSRAFRIFKTYGEQAIEKVQENPYRLAQDIWGIGFKTADQIAANLGIDRQSELRARAGVEYVLQTLTEDGHCAYPRERLAAQTVKMLEIEPEIVERALDHALAEERLVEHERPAGEAPLVYLAALETCEQRLAENLVALARQPHPCPPIDIAKAREWIESRQGFELAPNQREALAQAVQSKVMVITGGPGVGKTTLVSAIVQVFKAKGLRLVLAAPTGRAARRMAEATGLDARTIHRLLVFDPATAGFKHDAQHPLEGDVFIVDEASMIDLVLAHQLMRAIPPNAALLLVGDVDQLPSVGPGCVLRDIIDSGAVPVCRLTHIFRQAAQSAIVINAHRVNQGHMPQWPRPGDKTETDFYFVEAQEPEEGVGKLLRLVQERIPQRFGLDPVQDVQVLTPMQRGELGARNLNLALQQALNSEARGIQRYGWTFRLGDKVMQLVNDYDKDVFNGDVGRIAGLAEEERELLVRFEGRDVKYDLEELDELTLCYAATIHKSQGSEYPCVVIPIHSQHFTLLQRNLLYTAITRGRRLVVLVGTRRAIAMAVGRVESRGRITTLRERLAAKAATHSQANPWFL